MPISPQLMQLLQARGIVPQSPAPMTDDDTDQPLPQMVAPQMRPGQVTPTAALDLGSKMANAGLTLPPQGGAPAPPPDPAAGFKKATSAVGIPADPSQAAGRWQRTGETPKAPAPPAVFASAPGGSEQVHMTRYQGHGYGVTYVPEKDVSTIGPTERSEWLKAQEGKRGAIEDAVKADAGANAAAADSDEYMSAMAGSEAARAQSDDSRRDRAMREQEAEYARLQREASDGRAKYDRRSAGQRVAGAVFMALNAIGNAIQRRPDAANLAKEIIDKSIDADYREQLDTLGQKREAARDQGDLLARMRQRFGDERAAEAGFRAMRWQEYAAEADARAKRAQSPVLEARAKELRAMADMETARFDMDTHKWIPGGAVNTGPNLQKEYIAAQKEYDTAVLNGKVPPGSRFPSFEEWAATHGGAGGAAPVQGAAEGGTDKVQTPTDVPIPGSTRLNPARFFQGTQAYQDVNEQQRYNAALATAVVAKMGRGAERSPEMVKRFAAAYEIHPGDSPATIQMKVAAARRDFPGFASASGGPSAADLGATPLGGK